MDERASAGRGAADTREDEILGELLRLLRIDAEIMETVRDMVRAAGDEAARRPGVLLQSSGGTHDGDLLGGQVSQTNVLAQLLDLVKTEKPFVQQLIMKLLRL